MRISDAKPGDVLRDRDGGLWVKKHAGAASLTYPGDQMSPFVTEFGQNQLAHIEALGPFTRLIPEPANAP